VSAPDAVARHGKLDSVQVLRAVAALMVTIAHAVEEAKYFFGFRPGFDTISLGKGVDLFFVISGFIIFYSSRSLFARPGAVGTFAYNRLSRVAPLYYLFTTLMVLVVVFLPSGVKEARFDLGQIVTSYAFIPFERYDGRIAPILSLGWTLNYEIFFYGLFSLVMWLPARRAAAACVALLVGLAVVGVFVPDAAPAPFRFWTHNIILEFAMGIGIAVAYGAWGKRFARSGWIAAVPAVIGAAGLYILNLETPPIDLPRFLSAGVPAALILGAAVLLAPASVELAAPRWMTALGDSSYSLYLSHRFVQRPIQILVTQWSAGSAVSGILYVVLAVAVAIAAGHAIFLMLEQPLLGLLRQRPGRRTGVS